MDRVQIAHEEIMRLANTRSQDPGIFCGTSWMSRSIQEEKMAHRTLHIYLTYARGQRYKQLGACLAGATPCAYKHTSYPTLSWHWRANTCQRAASFVCTCLQSTNATFDAMSKF